MNASVPASITGRGDRPPNARAVLTMTARIAAGIGVALALHIAGVTFAFGVGLLVGHWFVAIVIGEFVLLVASLAAAITMAVRARHGEGVGILVGWLAGTVGMVVVGVVVVVMCVLAALALVGLMLVSMLVF